MEEKTLYGIARLEHGTYTEAGTAQRFEEVFGDSVLYADDADLWFIYDPDSGLWQQVIFSVILNLFVEISNMVEADCMDMENPDSRESAMKYVAKLRGSVHGKGASKFLEARLACKMADFDSNPRYMGLRNGKVLDLLECKIVDSNPKFLLTRCLQGNLLDKPIDSFEEYIETLFPDTEVRCYIQKYLGSALLGYRLRSLNDKSALFLDSKMNDTGKSTLLSLLELALGDYYKTVSIDLLTDNIRDANKPNPMLSMLRGARIVGISEVAPNSVFSDDNFKRLTGNDTLATRNIYGKMFYFKPDFRLLIVSNVLPKPQTMDIAFRRRFRRFTFTERLKKMNGNLLDEFTNQEFLDSFITWLVDGCKDYLDKGKMVDNYNGDNLSECSLPLQMKNTMKLYFTSNDDILDFFQSFFIKCANSKISWKDLHILYTNYTGDKITINKFIKGARPTIELLGLTEKRAYVLIVDDKGNEHMSNAQCVFGIRALKDTDAFSETQYAKNVSKSRSDE